MNYKAMNNNSSMDQDHRLWVLLLQTRDLIMKAREKELSQYGITVPQAAVLFTVKALEGKATPTEISKWLLRKPHTVSSSLKRMEKQGLLKKTKGFGKKGRVVFILTEKGEQAYSQTLKRGSIREIVSCLSQEERQQLGSCLEKLRHKAFKDVTHVELPFL